MKTRLLLPLALTLLLSGQLSVHGQTIIHDVERDFSIASAGVAAIMTIPSSW